MIHCQKGKKCLTSQLVVNADLKQKGKAFLFPQIKYTTTNKQK